MLIDQMHYLFKLGIDRVDSSDKIDFENYEIDSYLYQAIWSYLSDRYGIHRDKIKRGFETDQVRISQLSNLHIKSPHVQPGLSPVLIEPGIYEINLNRLGENIQGQYFRYLFLTDGYIKAKKGNCNKFIGLNHHQVDDTLTIYREPSWIWRRVNYNFGKSSFVNNYTNNSDPIQDPDGNAELIDSSNRYNNDELSSLYLDVRNKYGEPQFDIDEVYLSYIKYPNRVYSGGYNHNDGMSKIGDPQIHCDFDDIICQDIVKIAVRLAQKDIISDYKAMLQDELRDIQK